MHKCLARWLLHTNTIKWSDIRYGLQASAHLPASCLRGPLEIMESCWQTPVLRKLSVNSAIGLMCRKNNSFRVVSSTSPLDQPLDSRWERIFEYDGGHVYDWISEDAIVGSASKLPIWRQVMSSEHLRVGQAIFAIEMLGVPRASICEIKTDSILFVPGKRTKEQIRSKLASLSYDEMHDLRLTLSARPKRQRVLVDPVPLPVTPSSEAVYRVLDATQDDRMRCRPDLPKVEGFKPAAPFMPWRKLAAGDLRPTARNSELLFWIPAWCRTSAQTSC